MEEDRDSLNPAHCFQPLVKNFPEIYQGTIIFSGIEGRKQAEVMRINEISVSGAELEFSGGRKISTEGINIVLHLYSFQGRNICSGNTDLWTIVKYVDRRLLLFNSYLLYLIA